MTIFQIKKAFEESLNHLYNADEIKAIFSFYIEIKLNVLNSALFIDDTINYDIPEFTTDLQKLIEGKPVQQLLEKAFFYDYFFKVNEHTLIPRPETEELIYLITEQFDKDLNLNIIDLGTGSGCIPITLNKIFKNANVYGVDISEEALKVANFNNLNLGTNVQFIKQDLLQDFNLDDKFDIIISNPPYIRELEKAEMHKNVLNFEPHLALFVKNDNPLIFYDKIANFGRKHLKDNGKIYCEINQYLGKETKKLFLESFNNANLIKDLSRNERFIEIYF